MTKSYINTGLCVLMVNRVPLRSCCTAGQVLANSASECADFGFWGDTCAVHSAAVQSSCSCTALPPKHVRHKPALSLEVPRAEPSAKSPHDSTDTSNEGTQHRNEMVFPNGNHPTDLVCLHFSDCSHDYSCRAVCSYQMNYWFSNNMRGCITWIIISSCATKAYTEITV